MTKFWKKREDVESFAPLPPLLAQKNNLPRKEIGYFLNLIKQYCKFQIKFIIYI